jgi:pyruvate/2-oxoglutarate dehydrogenase complex dihydrolipoamide acyltransferase (E2) component
MGVFRGVVLPVARLLVWTVIAGALCVLAFRDDRAGTADGGPLEPGMQVGESFVVASRADVVSTVELTGTVVDDPSTTVRSTATGTVSKVHLAVGSPVVADTPVLQVEVQLEPTPDRTVTAADGTVTVVPGRARVQRVDVLAGAAGTLDSLAVLKGQEVAIGADVATVDPGTLTVRAPLTQSQQFRLLRPPAAATAQAPGGPAPFDCAELRTGAADTASDTASGTTQPAVDPYSGMPAEATTAQITCRVPAGTTVFAGMSVNLSIDVGSATQVLAVPLTAVLGTVEEGRVWVASPDGEAVETPVRLGLSDGTVVEVVEGLEEGQEVLEFPPAPVDDEGPQAIP